MANADFVVEDKGERPPFTFSVTLPPLPIEPEAEKPAPKRTAARSGNPARRAAKPATPAPRVETFTAHGFMPAWNVLEVEGMGRVSPQESARRYLSFFASAIIDEDWVRFCAMLQDRRNQIDTTDLGDIFTTLYELYSEGRPTPSA